MFWISLSILSSNLFISLTGVGDFMVLNPKVSLLGRLFGFKKRNAFHRIRRIMEELQRKARLVDREKVVLL